MRGVDSEGQVANYVETEQIVEYQGEKCSFVQVIHFISFQNCLSFNLNLDFDRLVVRSLYFGRNYPILNINRNQRPFKLLTI